jgi:hypothetical protein
VVPPGISFAGVDFAGRDSVMVQLELANPNRFTLTVLEVEYRALIAGELCGEGRRGEALRIRPGESVKAGFPVRLNYGSIGRVLPLVLRDTVTFSVGGTYSIPVFLGRRRLPFKSESRVSVRNQLENFMKALLREGSEGGRE